MIKSVFRVAFILVAAFLAACAYVPNDGPLGAKVVKQKTDRDLVYGLIALETGSLKALERHEYFPLSSKFGLTRFAPRNKIGVGDILNVTIFEAGPDGIFSTTEKKNVNIDLVVQQDGRISIPFDGTVKAAGKTTEQVRRLMIARLKGNAVEPDVIVNIRETNSRIAVVNGAIRAAKTVSLPSGRERMLDVIGAAGGPSKTPYDTYISVSRRGVTRTTLLQNLIDHPRENIYVHPDDAIYLTHDPRIFLAFGAVKKVGRHQFEARKMNLLDATAIAGGLDSVRANPAAYFVFRYEYEHVVRHLYEKHYIDDKQLGAVLSNKNARDSEGRLPIVYKIDMTKADNFFIAKRFPMRTGDAIYVARSASVDFARIVRLISLAVNSVDNATDIAN